MFFHEEKGERKSLVPSFIPILYYTEANVCRVSSIMNFWLLVLWKVLGTAMNKQLVEQGHVLTHYNSDAVITINIAVLHLALH